MANPFTEEEIASELKRLKYLCDLKRVLRWDGDRNEKVYTESVAEHVYSMMILFEYFYEHESKDKDMDKEAIKWIVLAHDMPEIVNGDVPIYKKTEADTDREREALSTVLEQSPKILKRKIETGFTSYDTQSSIEARFVKAIDKFDAMMEIFDGPRESLDTFRQRNTTRTEHGEFILKVSNGFPVIHAFMKSLEKRWDDQNLFVKDNND